jgi:hypothetical protein
LVATPKAVKDIPPNWFTCWLCGEEIDTALIKRNGPEPELIDIGDVIYYTFQCLECNVEWTHNLEWSIKI